ncbi:MAG: cell division protein FtsQ/DivIB [Candidatus Methylomirabilales bacterium]
MRFLRRAAAVALLATGLRLFLAVWGSPSLKLETVEVMGNRRVPAAQVVDQSGLKRGDHLLTLYTQSVAGRVEAIPWVARAEVERILPSKLRVTVAEREPAATVIVGSRSFLADENGLLLAEASEPGLVTIADLALPDPTAGVRIAVPQYAQVLAVLRSLPEELRARIKVVRAATLDQITLETEGGMSVVFGSAEDLDKKGRVLSLLLDHLGQTPVASIDVRAPERPAVRPR